MLKPEDIMVDTYRPSKRSGLRVGVDYGVKVTHKPTGILVVEDSERSQHRNRAIALQKLEKLVADAQTTGAAELPQALRLADELRKMDEAKKYHPSGPGGQMLGCEQYRLVASGFTFEHLQSAAAELRRLHAYCQELESQVILDCMTHVQNPAEIEHVADDVSKNGAETNMNAYAELPPSVGEYKYGGGLYTAAQMRVFADATHALRTQQPAPEYVGNGMFKGETIEKAAEHWANWCDVRCMTGLSEFLRVVAAHAPTDSVLEDAARWQWLADYLVGERTDLDEGIVACATIDALRQFADAARKQGANHE